MQEGGEVQRGVRRGGGDATEQTGARFENPGTLAVPVDDIFGNLMSQEAAEQFEIELNEDATFLINIVDAICKYDGTIFGGDGLVCMFLTEGGVRRGTERFLRRLESLNRREFTICCRMSVQASTFFKRDFNHSIVEDSSSTPTFSLCTPFGVEINVGLNHFPQHDLLLTTQDLLSMSRHGLHVREANLLSNLPNPPDTVQVHRVQTISLACDCSTDFLNLCWFAPVHAHAVVHTHERGRVQQRPPLEPDVRTKPRYLPLQRGQLLSVSG